MSVSHAGHWLAIAASIRSGTESNWRDVKTKENVYATSKLVVKMRNPFGELSV